MFKKDTTLHPSASRWLTLGSFLYALAIAIMCFAPQFPDGTESTPGVFYVGRLVFLLIPFNSIVNVGEVTSWLQLIKVFLQNIVNIFLLYPLFLQLILLFPGLRKTGKILIFGFILSLGIELTQLVLDYLWNFNRVFEMDDLWTNTLGAYLAYLTYLWIRSNGSPLAEKVRDFLYRHGSIKLFFKNLYRKS